MNCLAIMNKHIKFCPFFGQSLANLINLSENKMKKLTLIIFSILISLTIYGQDITGSWNGMITAMGKQYRLVFNISMEDTLYSSTMDSPDQGAKGIPVTTTSFENSVLKLEISNAKIQYEGTLDKDNMIKGTFKQSGYSFPLNLTRELLEKKKVIRPQDPVKPYPYYVEDVMFENAKDNISLAGTLTLPEKEGNFPALVLISGSGPQNRDEELMGHKPFLILADHLTKKGIAVLRFDDRGTAESKGNFNTATSLDFTKDVESAIKYLQTRKEINKDKIGLIGHSEGGMIAPMVTAENKDVNFIILLAGTGLRGDKLLLMQQELIGIASGIRDTDMKKTIDINKCAFDIIIKSDNTDSIKSDLRSYYKQAIKDDPESVKRTGISEGEYIELVINQLTSPWMIYFIKHDPALVLENVKCPVLAINGGKDTQVPAKENLEAIKKALEKGGNKNITIKELAKLNHLFQECETGLVSEYSTIEQTFSPVALKEISDWIIEIVK